MTRTPRAAPVDALDLSIRARRGALGAAEQSAFEQALVTSALLRVAHEAGRSFDAEGVVRAGDDELIARAARRALAGGAAPPRRAPMRLLVALAATLVVAAAAGAGLVLSERGERAAPSRLRAMPPASGERAPAEPRPTPAVSLAPPATDRATASKTAPAARPSAPSASPSPAAAPLTAAELFHDASAARRAGDLGRAQALYAELQARFPTSTEARVSEVSLGKLLLAAGHAREAELAFNAYLRGGPGDLAEEALVGRAGALGALGRSVEERATWMELLRTHAASVYRARAAARIDAIDATLHATSREP